MIAKKKTRNQKPIASPKDCPFCHSFQNAFLLMACVSEADEAINKSYQISCQKCGVAGASAQTRDLALRAWEGLPRDGLSLEEREAREAAAKIAASEIIEAKEEEEAAETPAEDPQETEDEESPYCGVKKGE